MSDYDRVARDKIAALETELATEVRALTERLKKLTAANDDLATAVTVLRQMLVEAGQLDDKVLQYRVEAAIEEARELRQRPRCGRCLQYRPPERMIITAQGYLCDPNCEATSP